MVSSSTWINGDNQALLLWQHVDAAWAMPPAMGKMRVELANRAFELYYIGMKHVNDPHLDYKHHKAMKKKMNSYLNAGVEVIGVGDLEDAFDHLAAKGTRWTDNTTDDYKGGVGKLFPQSVSGAPEFAVNFLTAVEEDLSEFKSKTLSQFTTHLKTIALAKPKTPEDWERINSTLGLIKTGMDSAQSFLWYGPTVQKALLTKGRLMRSDGKWQKVAQFDKMISSRLAAGVRFLDIYDYIATGLTTYAQFKRNRMPEDLAVGFAALKVTIKVVPILGEFYGKAIDAIPAFKTWFQGVIQQYVAKIDRLTAPNDYEAQENIRRMRRSQPGSARR